MRYDQSEGDWLNRRLTDMRAPGADLELLKNIQSALSKAIAPYGSVGGGQTISKMELTSERFGWMEWFHRLVAHKRFLELSAIAIDR